MKKYLFLILFFMLFNPQSNVANEVEKKTSITVSKTISVSQKKDKDGRFRRKKGFLWGLFKKKNACDCPKH